MSIIKKNKKKEFVLLNFNKDGPGVSKDAESFAGPPYTTSRGFRLFFSKFWKLISLNLMMLVSVIPVILILYFYFTGPKTPTYESVLYAPFAGISVFTAHSVPALETILDFHSYVIGVPYVDLLQFIKYALPLLFLFITMGWQNCGSTYIVRSMIKGDPVFIFSDYFYAVRRNLKQGFVIGAIDFLALFALITNFLFFNATAGTFGNDLMLFFTVAIAIIYMLMRFYIYLILITFDMKTQKIYKNSLIFAIIGFKRNFAAILYILLFAICVALLTYILSFFNIGATGILIGFMTIFACASFITAYCAYPVIEKYMVINE